MCLSQLINGFQLVKICTAAEFVCRYSRDGCYELLAV
jgi:hypothetical protein